MAGKQTFKGRRHRSRNGVASHVLTSHEIGALRVGLEKFLGCIVYADDFGDLVEAVVVARLLRLEQEKKGHTKPLETRHQIATLAGLSKISDDRALLVALLYCDMWSFEAVRSAWLDSMLVGLLCCHAGGFEPVRFVGLDVLPGPMELDPPDLYFHIGSLLADEHHAFPGGIGSLRRAIVVAHSRLTKPSGAACADSGGRPSKEHYQIPIAQRCVRLWERYGPPDKQRFWCEPSGGLRSDGVAFAAIIFEKAGMRPSADRLVSLLNKSAPAS